MLNLKILAERQPIFDDSAESLAVQGSSFLNHFHGSELVEAIETQTEVENSPGIFVLFWGTEGSLGEHALHLWKRSAYKWKNMINEKLNINREAVFGVVKCDEEGVELCHAFGILPKQKPQFLVFMDGQRVGQQMGLGDEEFFIDCTFRRFEGNSEEITHIGAFNVNSILQHITRESMPLISIHCVQVPTVEWFRDEFTNNIVELLGHAFLKASDNNDKITDGSWQRFFPHKSAYLFNFSDFENKPHPFMQLQLEQINKIFGRQQIKIKPEPINEHHHSLHNFDGMDNEKAAISGCPMMAHLNNIRDEL
uniref:Uncharacterized protein n=1 Tax=Meloidogyne javanica TaxID=6303 RepID=A0A915LIP3_MELJA